jgi:hypothetical protein
MQRRPRWRADAPVYTTGGISAQLTIAAAALSKLKGKERIIDAAVLRSGHLKIEVSAIF